MLVVGTGAVASFLLPKLAQTTEKLELYGSPSPRLIALERYGAVSSAGQLGQHSDWIVACKVGQNAEKIRQLRQAPAPRRVLVLQNGLAPEAEWRAAWPEARVERALSTYGVFSVAPGVARGGESGEIVVPRASNWAGVLSRAGLCLRTSGNMQVAIWRKLLVNASLNVVAALGELTNGGVLHHPEARATARRAAEEVATLARCCGLNLRLRDPAALMEKVAHDTADNICSTLADLRTGRECEYASINGELLGLARRRGLCLPTLEELDRRFTQLCLSRGGSPAPLAS